jgi:hypothetical protein
MPTALLDANRSSAHASRLYPVLPNRPPLVPKHPRQRASVLRLSHALLPLRHLLASQSLQMLDVDQVLEGRRALGRSGVTAAASSKLMQSLNWSIFTNI